MKMIRFDQKVEFKKLTELFGVSPSYMTFETTVGDFPLIAKLVVSDEKIEEVIEKLRENNIHGKLFELIPVEEEEALEEEFDETEEDI